jgi:hypothetical protein
VRAFAAADQGLDLLCVPTAAATWRAEAWRRRLRLTIDARSRFVDRNARTYNPYEAVGVLRCTTRPKSQNPPVL